MEYEYNVYIFAGIPIYRTSGTIEVKKITLLECFNAEFSNYYEKNMKDFFDRSFSYDIKKMTVKDIFNADGNKTVFIPFSVSVNKEEVINYINAGFSVAFMKAGEFKKMQKAYKEYV